MIISKDLFYLGDEYLRFQTEEKVSSSYSSGRSENADTGLHGQVEMLERRGSITENFNSMPLMTKSCTVKPTVLNFSHVTVPNLYPVNLAFKNLSYSVEDKCILNNVSGMVKPGEMVAIMGPSGSGKTTLLNALAGRLKCNSGKITLNGKALDKQLRRKICYVLQDDIFFSDLTVQQTLMYTAELRLPDHMPHQAKVEQVDRIMDILELNSCQDTIMGHVMDRGLSGGEKKRVNIGSELLTNPSVMLLDEPTSGLDSCTASSLLHTLKNYAENESKTLAVTIHQPSSQMFYMFDKLLLLCNGQVAYFGDVHKTVEHFSKIGMEIIPHYNPADFIIEQVKKGAEVQSQIILAAMEQRKEQTRPMEVSENYNDYIEGYIETYSSDNVSKTGHQTYCSDWKNVNEDVAELNRKNSCNGDRKKVQVSIIIDSQENVSPAYTKIANQGSDSGRSSWSDFPECSSIDSDNGLISSDPKWPTSFYTQFKVLTRRNIMASKRNTLSKLNFIQAIGLAFVSGIIWFKVERTEERLDDIMGWMFFGMTFWMLFTLFGALLAFPAEREVINKERASGAYRLSAYYLAKMVGELPLALILPTIFHAISYTMLGFNNPITSFSIWIVLVLNTIVAQSVGLFIGVIFTDIQVSMTTSSLFTISTMLFGGYYSNIIPYWIQWLQHLSMVHYALNNMQIMEFTYGDPIVCSSKNSKFAACLQGNNTHIPLEDLLNMKGPSHGVWINFLILFGFFVVFRIAGYFVLRHFRKPR